MAVARAKTRSKDASRWHRFERSILVKALRARLDVMLAIFDSVLALGAFLCTMVLHYSGRVPSPAREDFLFPFAPLAIAVVLLSNGVWGLYGSVWRHASVHEARRLIASCLTFMAILTLMVSIPGQLFIPRTTVVSGSLLAMFLMGTVRFQARLFSFRRGDESATSAPGMRIAIIGAGDAGAAVVREMLRNPDLGMRPVVVLDDDPRKRGRFLSGVPVAGGVDELAALAEQQRVHRAYLAIPSADTELVRRAVAAAEAARVPIKIVAKAGDRISGASVREARPVNIEDLLGRKQVTTDLDAVSNVLRCRTVMITGAGGSIGSEIARQVSKFEPETLILVDHDETHLHDAAATVGASVQVLLDIRDQAAVDDAFNRYRPDVVFHAAAHKHVPILEEHPCEAVTTNLGGTRNLLEAANRVGVSRFVFISTDKAVKPSSVMGASKRLGEQLVLNAMPSHARYCCVRFGNVLGSRGSVIPTFSRQIAEGGPLTVTDVEMTRYFMSVVEAVQLVLQASALAGGGEVFMLDMGEPVRIMELAERMIRLNGYRVGEDIDIQVTGIRPGEKLHEQLLTIDERPEPTVHPSIVRLRPLHINGRTLHERLELLEHLARLRRNEAVREQLLDLARVAPLTADPANGIVLDLREITVSSTRPDPTVST